MTKHKRLIQAKLGVGYKINNHCDQNADEIVNPSLVQNIRRKLNFQISFMSALRKMIP